MSSGGSKESLFTSLPSSLLTSPTQQDLLSEFYTLMVPLLLKTKLVQILVAKPMGKMT